MIILKSIHFLREERFGIIYLFLVQWMPEELAVSGSSWSPQLSYSKEISVLRSGLRNCKYKSKRNTQG